MNHLVAGCKAKSIMAFCDSIECLKDSYARGTLLSWIELVVLKLQVVDGRVRQGRFHFKFSLSITHLESIDSFCVMSAALEC